MSRAVILQLQGDPVILNHLIYKFKEVWRDEIDKLYVVLTFPPMGEDIRDMARSILSGDEKIVVKEIEGQRHHGTAMREGLDMVTEKYVMLLEDDTVIFKRGAVDKYFRKLETGEADILGSPRMSCSANIVEASRIKYNLDYTGYGDKGPNFWPNFFFTHASMLRATDQHFENNFWAPGSYIKELELEVKEDTAGDTFVWASIQLRSMGLIIQEIPQYHSHPDEMTNPRIANVSILDGHCPWVHIGSLSGTIDDIILGDTTSGRYSPTMTEMEKRELGRRFAWLNVFLNKFDDCPFKTMYMEKINEYIKVFGLSYNYVKHLGAMYRSLIA